MGAEADIQRIEMEVKGLGQNVDRLCSSNGELIQEMREMTAVLTKHMVENKEHAVNIEHLREGQGVVFTRIRRLEDEQCPAVQKQVQVISASVQAVEVSTAGLPGKVDELEKWQNKMRGSLLTVPVLCAAVSAVAAMLSFIFSIRG